MYTSKKSSFLNVTHLNTFICFYFLFIFNQVFIFRHVLCSYYLSGHAKDALGQQHHEPPASRQWCPQTEPGVWNLQKVKVMSQEMCVNVPNRADSLQNWCPLLFWSSIESFDRRFDKVMSLQILDKSKAINQILQEVRCGPWREKTALVEHLKFELMTPCHFLNAGCRRRCRRLRSRPCSCRKTSCTTSFVTRSLWGWS